ncbi:MAG: alpha/beta hydrolase [Coriobacteriia bacterium]|nr:alpha/beta hydrolase [Coriobacteriia bacterium]
MKNRLRLVAVSLLGVLVVASVGFYAWTRVARYPAFPEAAALAAEARTDHGWYVFEPAGETTAGFIFYPGGLVDPAAYAPLMRQLSSGGVLAVIIPMPLDLAVFGINRADDVIAAYPDVDTWVIGGHSLGGAMAAEYLKSEPAAIDGIVFLASYPADSTDLSGIPAIALSIYGTEDGVAGEVFEASLQRLPDGTSLEVLDGGNHAQFGHYGPQEGDGTATLSREEQQRLTTDAILSLVGVLQ